VAGYESERFAAYECRQAWWKLLEDRGLRPTFVTSQQVEAGALIERGITVLILPRAIALSDAEAAAMRQFVEAGGVLVADSFAGRMDEHCRERETGVLDAFFGIRRLEPVGYEASRQRASFSRDAEPGDRPRWGGGPVRADLALIEDGLEPVGDVTVMGCTEMTDAPISIVAEHGRGKGVLLNAAPLAYVAERRRVGGGRALQEVFGWFLESAGVTPLVQVVDAKSGDVLPGWRAWSFAHGAARYVGLAPDVQVAQDTLGAISAETAESAGRRVRITFAAARPKNGAEPLDTRSGPTPLSPVHVYEARTGRYLGEGDTIEDTLDATSARLYAVLPYRVADLDLEFADGAATAHLKTAGSAEAGEHILRFDLVDAEGKRLLDAGANVVAPGGTATWRPDGHLPADGRLRCRDVATGVTAEVALSL